MNTLIIILKLLGIYANVSLLIFCCFITEDIIKQGKRLKCISKAEIIFMRSAAFGGTALVSILTVGATIVFVIGI